jgi:hypothetical protein
MVEYIENMRTFDSITLKVYGCQSFDLQKFHVFSGGLRFWKIKKVHCYRQTTQMNSKNILPFQPFFVWSMI